MAIPIRFPRCSKLPRRLVVFLGALASLMSMACRAELSRADLPDADPGPTHLDAGLSVGYDDNVTRAAPSGTVLSDTFTILRMDGTAQLHDGPRTLDISAGATRQIFSKTATLDYTGLHVSLIGEQDLGRDAHLALRASQSQDVLPLSNFQTLIRDGVTSRTAGANLAYRLGAYYRADVDLSHGWSLNDNPLFAYNDNESNTAAIGLTHTLPSGSELGLRESYTALSYARALSASAAQAVNVVLSNGQNRAPVAQAGNSAYTERSFSPFFTWATTALTTVSAQIAVVDRTYETLIGDNVRSTFGKLSIETGRGGRLTGGMALRRELGGTSYLASRLVQTDDFRVNASYALTALSRLDASLDSIRRRYSVDQVGFPAHREYENVLALGGRISPARGLAVSLTFQGDWRHATPDFYRYTDRRLVLNGLYEL